VDEVVVASMRGRPDDVVRELRRQAEGDDVALREEVLLLRLKDRVAKS
jgi:hypothetical protein